MAPSKMAKFVQSTLPEAFRKITKGRVEKPKLARASTLSKLDDSGKEKAVEEAAVATVAAAAPPPPSPPPADSAANENAVGTEAAAVAEAAVAAAGIPVLRDDGEEMVGLGAYQAVCHVKTVDVESTTLFNGPVKQVKKTVEAADEHRRRALEYPVIRESTVVRTRDGRPLLYFLKKGIFAAMSAEEQQHMGQQSVDAIRGLIDAYKPPVPPTEDPRMKERGAQKMREWAEKGKAFGRYYFAYWIPLGQSGVKEPAVSADSKIHMEEVSTYMQDTAWEHTQISRWIAALDPDRHQELHDRYQELGGEKLQHLYQGAEACHSGLALLVNQAVGPHKDSNDAKDSWTSTNSWGHFQGGDLIIPDYGFRVAQKEGDIVLSHAAILTHMVDEIEDGERFCHVRYTKKNILRPPETKTSLEIPCPMAGCQRSCRSWDILRKHLHGPSGKGRENATKARYHLLDKEETKEKMAEAKRAYQALGTAPQDSSLQSV